MSDIEFPVRLCCQSEVEFIDQFWQLSTEKPTRPSDTATIGKDRLILQVIEVNTEIIDQVILDKAKPLQLLLGKCVASTNAGYRCFDPLFCGQNWKLLPCGMLDHRYDVGKLLVVNAGMRLFQFSFIEIVLAESLPKLFKCLGIPIFRAFKQDLNGCNLILVFADEF